MRTFRYRIVQTEPAFFAPQVRRGWRWVGLDDRGAELPLGVRWSGPLEWAARGIRSHDPRTDWASLERMPALSPTLPVKDR